jgi:hypothetical protein
LKLDDCKRCTYHYKSQLDDILCEFSGAFDYRVVTLDKKGKPLVVMCPLDNPLKKKDPGIVAKNMTFLVNIS